MLKDLESQLQTDYRSGRDSLLGDFYLPCLGEALAYDRAVGYFRSSLMHVVAVAYSDFVRRGGRARLICSPSMLPEDFEAIKSGMDARRAGRESVARDLDFMMEDPESMPATRLLSTLVALGFLDVRVAFTEDNKGIFHDKIGLFEDEEGRRVSFVGSANETWAAWGLNHESFEVFASWRGERELLRTRNHAEFFERLWSNSEEGVAVEPLEDVSRARLLSVADQDIDTAVDRVRSGVLEAPKVRTLFRHQRAVLDDWERCDRRGIVAFATGAGKTLTAIEAIKRWTKTGCPALVLVPSGDLHRQWAKELRANIPDCRLLLCGAGYGSGKWASLLSLFSDRAVAGGPPQVILCTHQTFASTAFRERIRNPHELLLVADEMHRAGSIQTLEAIESMTFGATMGLSATYQRQFDDAGTQRLMAVFGRVLEPVIGLAEAIVLKILVPYDYRLHTLQLDDDELESYAILTEKIRRQAAFSDGDGMSEHLQMLLIQRARILKQARAKAPRAIEILRTEYQAGDRWLVYCDDRTQLDEVIQLGLAARLPVLEYHSSMSGDRAAVLDSLTGHGGIVVAIRCLDEGVDIPACDRALILASSTVEREYIQRRGRVLRTAPHKVSAEVHDLLLVNEQDGALTRGEAARALEFARLARNPGARARLQLLLALSPDLVDDHMAQLLGLRGEELEDEEGSP